MIWDYRNEKDKSYFLVTNEIGEIVKGIFNSRKDAGIAIQECKESEDSIFESDDVIVEVRGLRFFIWNSFSKTDEKNKPWERLDNDGFNGSSVAI